MLKGNLFRNFFNNLTICYNNLLILTVSELRKNIVKIVATQ